MKSLTGTPKIMATVKEFSAMSGIGQNRVRELCYLEGFPATKPGNRFLIHVEAANDWLRRQAEGKIGIETAALKKIAP